jgi:hypothetical protein
MKEHHMNTPRLDNVSMRGEVVNGMPRVVIEPINPDKPALAILDSVEVDFRGRYAIVRLFVHPVLTNGSEIVRVAVPAEVAG